MANGAYKDKIDALKLMLPVTRSARFLSRMSSHRPEKPWDWSTMLAMPRWASSAKSEQNRIAAICALLHFRQQIDAELSGPRLSGLAGLVGEDVFDAACEASLSPEWPLAETDAALPTPQALHKIGWQILNASLPNQCNVQVMKPLSTAHSTPDDMRKTCMDMANIATDIAILCASKSDDSRQDDMDANGMKTDSESASA